MSDRDEVDPAMLWILWGALLASVGLYGVVAHVLETPGSDISRGMLRTLAYVFAAVSIAEVAITWWLRKTMYFDGSGETDSGEQGRAQSLFTMSIITWAICESVAIYGLVLRVLSGQIAYFYPFAAASFLLFVLYRPRPAERLPENGDEELADAPGTEAEW